MSLLIKALKKAEKDNQAALEEDASPAFDLQMDDESDAPPTGAGGEAPNPDAGEGLVTGVVPDADPATGSPRTPVSGAVPAEPGQEAPSERVPLAFAEEGDRIDTISPAVEIPRHAPGDSLQAPPSSPANPPAPQPALEPLATQPVLGEAPGAPSLGAQPVPEVPAPTPENNIRKAQPMVMPRTKRPSRGLVAGAVAVGVIAALAWAGMMYLQDQTNSGAVQGAIGLQSSVGSPTDPAFNNNTAGPADISTGLSNTQDAVTPGESSLVSTSSPVASRPTAAAAEPSASNRPEKRPTQRKPATATASTGQVKKEPVPVSNRTSRSTPTVKAPDAPALPPVRFVSRSSVREKKLSVLNDAYGALRAGKLTHARDLYSEALKLDRNLSDAWIGLASVAAQSGDNTLAEQHYQQALRINPNDRVAQAGLATLSEQGDLVEQESRLRNLAAQSDSDAAVQFALGNTLASQGRWAEAQQAYFNASAAEPAHPDYAFNLAIALEHIRQPLAALTHYRRAIEAAQYAPSGFDPARAQSRIDAIDAATAGR